MKFELLAQRKYRVQTNYRSSDLFKLWMVSIRFHLIDARM